MCVNINKGNIMTNRSLISQMLSIDIPETLFHYTSSAGLIGILSSQKIWTTKILYLNDNSELNLAFEYIRHEIDQQRKRIGKTRTDEELDKMIQALDSVKRINISVTSFTEIGDQLSQWRGYCEIGNGYSIGFNGSNLRRQVHKQAGYNLVPCIYEEKEHKRLVKELVDNYLSKEMLESVKNKLEFGKDTMLPFHFGFINAVLFLGPLIKAEGFKEEKEWRLITPILDIRDAKFRQGKYSLIPFWEFDLDLLNTLDSIVIGPTPEPKLSSEAVKGLLMKENIELYQKVKVPESKIPFREI